MLYWSNRPTLKLGPKLGQKRKKLGKMARKRKGKIKKKKNTKHVFAKKKLQLPSQSNNKRHRRKGEIH